MYHIIFIHSSVNGNSGCFHILAIVNSASVNPGVHVSFSIMAFSGYMSSSGIGSGSYSSSIFSFFKEITLLFGRRKCQPTPVVSRILNPGERGAWWAAVHRVRHD